MAYSMVAIYGMNKKVGNVSYYDPNSEYSFNKPYSEDTAKTIDEEVKKLIEECHQRTLDLLRQRRAELEAIAHELLQKEILYKHDLERLIGKRPYEPRHVYDENGQENLPPPQEPATPVIPHVTDTPGQSTTEDQPVTPTGVS
jgi:cell division protease FtsH